MDSIIHKCESRDFLLVILLLQVIVYAVIFFNVPVIRPVIGFIYFTFVPGLIIAKLLKLNKFSLLETLLFSAGLSIAFLMIIGLLTNEVLFALGFSKPLSSLPLMIILNMFVLIGGVLVCLRSENIEFWEVKTIKKVLPFAVPLIVLPILSIVGAMWVNVYGDNVLLLLMLVIIAIVFVIGVIYRKRLPSSFYPLAIAMIAIALLFHASLISQYVVSFGSDVPNEYFIYQTTESNAHWGSYFGFGDLLYDRYNAMLSITILPTTYSVLLGLDPTYIIKLLYPLLFAFVPLALYCLWRSNFGDKRAFAAAFLFMATNTFYVELLGLTRQIIAELFFVLLLFVITKEKMRPVNTVVCFLIFSFALVTSHYGLAEIFLLFISVAYFSLIIMKRLSRNLNLTLVVSFFVIMFSWYLFTSGSAVFDSTVDFGNYVYQQLGQFLDLSSRGTSVLRGLGLESSPSLLNTVGRMFAYITEFFIVAGFVGLIVRRKEGQLKNVNFLLMAIAMVSLVALIAVPGLANTMNMSRFYHILLFFLAPLCVLGAEKLVQLIFERRKALVVSILLCIVLVPYFLFQTNFVYEVAGTQSWSVPLSKYRMSGISLRTDWGYFDESEVVGALWVSKNVDVTNSRFYGDAASAGALLVGQGLIHGIYTQILSNVTALPAKAIVYLNRANLVEGVGAGLSYFWNTTSISPALELANKVYSNGGCEIYKNTIEFQAPTP